MTPLSTSLLGACCALSLNGDLKATTGTDEDISVVFLEFPSEKVTAGSVDNEGLISAVKGEKGNISRSGSDDTLLPQVR